MTLEALWNRIFGPGGSTRHLHQCETAQALFNAYSLLANGGDTGLTGISKDRYVVFGEIPPLSVQIKMNANDNNVAPVAMAA